jgi:hypothetical protein
MDNKYQKGKIYKIINSIDNKVYIGSTIAKLYQRIDNHRTKCKDPNRNSKFYQHMRNIGIEYFKIILIRNFPCSSKEELEAEEFKEMSNYESDILLNEDILYKKKSTEHARKVGEAFRGDKSVNWKYGSIFRRQGKGTDGYVLDSWCFSYYEWKDGNKDKSQKRVQFSIKKYGEEQAKLNAIAAQKQRFPDAPDFEN